MRANRSRVFDFEKLYDDFVDFVWRNARRLGISESGAAAARGLLWKLSAMVLVMGAAGAGAGAMMNVIDGPTLAPRELAPRELASRKLASQEPAPTVTMRAVIPPTTRVTITPTTQPSTAPTDVEAPPPRASSSSSLAKETALLSKAQRALQSGDANQALELLDKHEREHAHGVLEEERSAARVIALCKLEKRAEATAAAADFLARYPNSPHARRVERCPRRIGKKDQNQ